MTFTKLTGVELAQVIADPQQARSILWRPPTGDGPSGSVEGNRRHPVPAVGRRRADRYRSPTNARRAHPDPKR
ncbi:hypothetical protein L838_5019 [Mycobacterium avium MAV_120709_2344]|nr:hypothetical protein L838_5019 [Mycobacterium avium MAV_120709_2344]ETZ42503.1 hypothetical protein L837_4754 [Mycobacterium avium MAV_061107_1842]